MRRTSVVLLAGALGLGAVGLAACGDDAGDQIAEEIVEGSGGGDIDIDSDDGEVTIEGEDGEGSFSIGSGELPDGFPEDVPLPEGDIVSSFASETDNGEAWSVTIQVDDASDAAEEYQATLEDEDYRIDGNFSLSGGDGGLSSFQAIGSNWDVNVVAADAVSEDEAGLVVTVTTHDPNLDEAG